MTSKNSFFNLLKEDFKSRLWSFAASCVLFFFTLPVVASLFIKSDGFWYGTEGENTRERMQSLIEGFAKYLSLHNVVLNVCVLFLAIVLAISGFAYLQSKKKVDFYHSLPLRRELLFSVKVVDGFLIFALPYLLCTILAAALMAMHTQDMSVFGIGLYHFVLRTACFLLAYVTAILAFLLTGNTFVGMLAIGVFYFYIPLLTVLYYAYVGSFWKNVYIPGDKVLQQSFLGSAFFWMFRIGEIGDIKRGLIALGVALPILAAALLVYKKRPSEAAGHAMAFAWTKVPIKFLLVVWITLFSILMGYYIQNDNGGFGWIIFGLLAGSVISHSVIEIIYHSDFKKLFAHVEHLALCMLIAVLIFCAFFFDFWRQNRFVPRAEDVKSVGLIGNALEPNMEQYTRKLRIYGQGSNAYADIEGGMGRYEDSSTDSYLEQARQIQIQDTEAILALAARCVEEMEKSSPHMTDMTRVLVAYQMKNGREVVREYIVDSTKIRQELEAVYNNLAYKEALYPILKQRPEDIVSLDYNGVGFSDMHISLEDSALRNALLKAYQEDLRSLTAETRNREYPFASLRFHTAESQAALELEALQQLNMEEGVVEHSGIAAAVYADTFDTVGYYPLYPSFAATRSVLEEMGIVPKTGFLAEDFTKIEYSRYYYGEENGEYKTETVTITDKAQMQEILDKALLTDHPYRLYERYAESETMVSAYIGDTWSMDLYFLPHHVPEILE